MIRDLLQFDDRYAALFWSHVPRAAENTVKLCEDAALEIWIYESPSLTVCIALGDQHTESVIGWLQKAHDTVEGSSLLAGVILAGAKSPPPSECYLFRTSSKQVSDASLQGIVSGGQSFCLYGSASDEIYIFVTSSAGLDLVRRFPELCSPHTGLVFRISSVLKLPEKQAGKPYDPIEAQISEVRYRTPVALRQQIKELKEAWVKRLEEEPPPELLRLEEELDYHLGDLPQWLESMEDNGKALSLHVDRLALWMAAAFEQNASLMSALDDYSEPVDPWVRPVSYSCHAHHLVLMGTRRLLSELLDRAGISGSTKVIPAFGDTLSLGSWQILHPAAVTRSKSLPLTKRTVITLLSRRFKLRAGVLPLLAHQVAHQIVDAEDDLTLQIANGAYGGESATLRSLFEERGLHAESGGATSEAALSVVMARAQQLQTAVRWAREILSDLVAVALSGPAFVYAFSRFSGATLRESIEEVPQRETFPPFLKRVTVCLEFLESLGFRVPYRSRYLDLKVEPFAHDLAARIRALVRMPYLPAEHERAVGEIKARLADGRPVSAPPTLILNALWDSVVRKDAYINELAMVLSLRGG